jgi:hypothetical protein
MSSWLEDDYAPATRAVWPSLLAAALLLALIAGLVIWLTRRG